MKIISASSIYKFPDDDFILYNRSIGVVEFRHGRSGEIYSAMNAILYRRRVMESENTTPEVKTKIREWLNKVGVI